MLKMTIVRAKRLGWNEGSTGNVTRIDILDPYDYEDDDLVGAHLEKVVYTHIIGPYTLHPVDGQPADPATIEPLEGDETS